VYSHVYSHVSFSSSSPHSFVGAALSISFHVREVDIVRDEFFQAPHPALE
jgi:hypothetical protein